MALEGTLKDFALPDIFQLIGLQKKSGVLVLKNESDEVTIGFKDGMLVAADSRKRRLEDRLGTMLVRSQLITEGQLHDILEKQKQTLQRVGVLLINEGLIRKDDLSRALELQVTQIIYRVFRWEDAYYRFDQDAPVDYDVENFTPIGAESILMEGMRVLDEWPIVEKVVRSLQTVYEKVAVTQAVEIEGGPEEESDDFDFDLSKAKIVKQQAEDKILLSREEGGVYKFIDGKRSVEDLMYLARLSEFDTYKAVYDLLNRDLIREKTTGGSVAAGAGVVQARAKEISPVLVWAGIIVVALVALAGAALFKFNPVPLNGGYPMGLGMAEVTRIEHAAIGSRLDRAVHAVEAQRLSEGDTRYVDHLEELVDLGHLRLSDIRNLWGEPFDHSVGSDGNSFRVHAFDREGVEVPDLARQGGVATGRE